MSATEPSFTYSHESLGMRISRPPMLDHVYSARKARRVVKSLGRFRQDRARVVCRWLAPDW